MQIYFSTLEDMAQQTMQLDHVQCNHCGQVSQLVSHGFVYKDQPFHTAPAPVGKRVFCSNRYGRTGCGKTVRLYLDAIIRYVNFAGGVVVAFVLALMQGATITKAYHQVTGTLDARNAYRWLHKLRARISHFRSLFALTSVDEVTPCCSPPTSIRRRWLTRTFSQLMSHLPPPLCSNYQRLFQTRFI